MGEEDAVGDVDDLDPVDGMDSREDRVEVLLVVREDGDVADLRRSVDPNEIDRAEQAARLADRGGQARERARPVLDPDSDRRAE